MIVYFEFGLVVCLTMSMGFALLRVIPYDFGIKSEVSLRWLKWTGNGSMLMSFLSIISIAEIFSSRFTLDYFTSFLQVLYGTGEGFGWIGILAANTFLLGFLSFIEFSKNRFWNYAIVGLVVIMLVSYSRARHVSSLDPHWGFFSQSVHILAVSIWFGILVVIAWFSNAHVDWQRFLKWFTPLSLICMSAIVVAGIFVMEYVAPEYVQSWEFTYGQSLLIKHLLMIPLFTFAFINGFLFYSKVKRDPSFNPIPWLRAESIIGFMLLLVTSYMSQQAPPHQVSVTLLNEKPSALFLYWFQGKFDPSHPLHLELTAEGLVLSFMSVLMFLVVIFCYMNFKRLPTLFVGAATSFGVLSAYMAIMMMVH